MIMVLTPPTWARTSLFKTVLSRDSRSQKSPWEAYWSDSPWETYLLGSPMETYWSKSPWETDGSGVSVSRLVKLEPLEANGIHLTRNAGGRGLANFRCPQLG